MHVSGINQYAAVVSCLGVHLVVAELIDNLGWERRELIEAARGAVAVDCHGNQCCHGQAVRHSELQCM